MYSESPTIVAGAIGAGLGACGGAVSFGGGALGKDIILIQIHRD